MKAIFISHHLIKQGKNKLVNMWLKLGLFKIIIIDSMLYVVLNGSGGLLDKHEELLWVSWRKMVIKRDKKDRLEFFQKVC